MVIDNHNNQKAAGERPSQARVMLGNKLRKAREVARLTQQQVAKAAGINVSYYAEIERGEVNPSYDKLQDIGKILKIKSIEIL
jgi:transcriptional regulator with XRE-family HTH domain